MDIDLNAIASVAMDILSVAWAPSLVIALFACLMYFDDKQRLKQHNAPAAVRARELRNAAAEACEIASREPSDENRQAAAAAIAAQLCYTASRQPVARNFEAAAGALKAAE